jgi:hypothetical protein
LNSALKGVGNALGLRPKKRGGLRFNHVQNAIFGTPWQSYREMLREYTIMTGNFSLLISKYLNHQIEYLSESISAGKVANNELSKTVQELLTTVAKIKENSEAVNNNSTGLSSQTHVVEEEEEVPGGSATKRRRYRKRKTRRSYTRKC